MVGKLAEKAVAEILSELSKEVKDAIKRDPAKRAALQAAFQAGLEAALGKMNPEKDSQRLERYAGALQFWLQDPQVAAEIAKLEAPALLRDPARVIDIPTLEARFNESHDVVANPDAFAGLNFRDALAAFARAYANAVEKQADKFPWLALQLAKEQVERKKPRVRSDTLRDDYLNWLADECDLLPLRVHTPRGTGAETKAKLREVYVRLDVRQLARAEKKPKDWRAWTPEELAQVEKEERVPALRALAQNRLAVLFGDPGSGKTTLTNHLALCLAKEELEPGKGWLKEIADWKPGRMLPVRIELRQLAGRVLNKERRGYAGMLWKFLEDEAARHYPGFFPALEKELREQGGLIILDGFDEVTEAEGRRDRVREAIADLLRTTNKCRVILTCRTYAYASIQLRDFVGYPLLPFSPEQIGQFIERWYQIVGPREHLTKELIAYRAASLKDAVDAQRNPHIAELAARPLLLTLMTMVYTSAGKLPEDRADLYRRCVELLLDVWQRRIEERDADGTLVTDGGILEKLDLSEESLRNALYRVAYQAHARQGASQQREQRTADIQSDELRKAFALDGEQFETVLKYIQNRAGLIYWRGEDVYTFPHRSFQEYLTACHLGTQTKDQTRRLVRHDPEWWREVFLLQVGQRRERLDDARALVEFLCPADCKPEGKIENADWQSAILAGQALMELRLPERIAEKKQHNEDVEPFEVLVNRIRHWLHALVETTALTPRERAQAGLTLGALDDPRNLDELCLVPAGEFTMGDKNGAQDEAKREHTVLVPEFWIAKYPVTCAQYQRFIDAPGYANEKYWKSNAAKSWLKQSKQTAPKLWEDSRWNNKSNLPVVGVTWFEANAYCEWLTERIANGELRIADSAAETAIRNSKFVIRLPTEAEWEKAATWDAEKKKKNVWPWGDTFDRAKANTSEGDDSIGGTTVVGIYPNGASPCGARDLAGNVWEWCSTVYQDYPYRLDANHESPETEGARVLRGGSWYRPQANARGAVRLRSGAGRWDYYLGFRVVVASSLKF